MTRGSDLVEEAIRRFQEGKDREGSFRFLYETYFPAIERFFARKGLSPEDCLDLTQETFLGIYRGMDSYEHRHQFTAQRLRASETKPAKLRALQAAIDAQVANLESLRGEIRRGSPLLHAPAPAVTRRELLDEDTSSWNTGRRGCHAPGPPEAHMPEIIDLSQEIFGNASLSRPSRSDGHDARLPRAVGRRYWERHWERH